MNTEDVLKRLAGSVAVIGNACMCANKGAEIDSYDNVIRLNNYQTVGFEDTVGGKVTLWCTHGNSDDIKPRSDVDLAVSPFLQIGPETGVQIPHRIVYSTISPQDLIGISRPTTGGALLALLDHLNITTIAYGFDFLKTSQYFSTQHCHNKGTHMQLNIEEEYIRNASSIRIIPL